MRKTYRCQTRKLQTRWHLNQRQLKSKFRFPLNQDTLLNAVSKDAKREAEDRIEGAFGEENQDKTLVCEFDKIFSLLNNLALAEDSNALKLSDIAERFGWYYTRTMRHETLKKYCEKTGFVYVPLLTKKLNAYFDANRVPKAGG